MENLINPAYFSEINNQAEFLTLLSELEILKANVKKAEENFKQAGIQYMRYNKISEIQLNNEVKFIIKEKSTDRYESDSILSAMNCPSDLREMLPKNPNFRKRAILKDPRTAGFWSEDITDILEIKKLDNKYIGGR